MPAVGPLDQQDLLAVVVDHRAHGHLGRDVAGDAVAHALHPLLDEVLGVEALVGLRRGPDVAGHRQDLVEPLPLVEALGEAEPGAGDAGQRLGPADQVLAGRGKATAHPADVTVAGAGDFRGFRGRVDRRWRRCRWSRPAWRWPSPRAGGRGRPGPRTAMNASSPADGLTDGATVTATVTGVSSTASSCASAGPGRRRHADCDDSDIVLDAAVAGTVTVSLRVDAVIQPGVDGTRAPTPVDCRCRGGASCSPPAAPAPRSAHAPLDCRARRPAVPTAGGDARGGTPGHGVVDCRVAGACSLVVTQDGRVDPSTDRDPAPGVRRRPAAHAHADRHARRRPGGGQVVNVPGRGRRPLIGMLQCPARARAGDVSVPPTPVLHLQRGFTESFSVVAAIRSPTGAVATAGPGRHCEIVAVASSRSRRVATSGSSR